MQSVSSELWDLLRLAGVPFDETREPVPPPFGSPPGTTITRVKYATQQPSRWVVAHRNTSGLITITVKATECLAITRIEAFNVNYSATATIAVRNSTNTVAQNAQPLITVVSPSTLFVFPPGKAIFNFVFSALPMTTARVQVRGYRLPKIALNKLSLIATEELSF
jgi:hypothetical protein